MKMVVGGFEADQDERDKGNQHLDIKARLMEHANTVDSHRRTSTGQCRCLSSHAGPREESSGPVLVGAAAAVHRLRASYANRKTLLLRRRN